MLKRLKALSVVPFVLFLSGCFLLGAEIVVNFDVQGGVPIEPVVYTISTNESVYSYLPTPVKEGHTFIGWFAGTEGRDEVNVSQAVEGQLYVYARWEVNQYIFEVERPEEIGSIDFQLEYDAEIPVDELNVPGYTFDGLFWDEAYTDGFTFDRLPGEDITVYAKYTPNEYRLTIHYNYLDEIEPESFTLQYNEVIDFPEMSQPEATFDGWFTGNFFATPFDLESMPSYNVDIYAKWDYNEYPVNYNLNGGVRNGGVTQTSIDYGSPIDLSAPSYPGYHFRGWFINEALTTPVSISTMTNETVDLYAKWELRDYTVDIYEESYLEFKLADSNHEGSVYLDQNNQMYFYGSIFGRNYSELTKMAFDIYLGENESILDVNLAIDHIVVLTNLGRVLTRGRNSFATGAGPDYSTNLVFYDITPSLGGVTITGIHARYFETFLWNDAGDVFVFGSNNNQKLIGETPASSYFERPVNVSDLFNLGENEVIVEVADGYQFGLALSSLGRVFAWGSNEERALTGDIVSSSVPIDITDQMNLRNAETITRLLASDNNGFVLTSEGRLLGWGSRWNNMLMRYYNDPIASPLDLTSEFSLGNNETISDVFITSNNGYATTSLGRIFSWGSNESGQLGLDNTNWYDGTHDITNIFSFNDNETLIFGNGFESLGFFISSENRLSVLGSNRNSRVPISLISTNVPIEIIIDDWRLFDTIILNYEDPITLSTPRAIEGYVFEDYYLDEALTIALVSEVMPDDDLTLYPKYNPIPYELSFEVNGGVTLSSLTVNFEDEIALPNPERYGYIFKGWYGDEALESPVNDFIMPSENRMLYAKWEPITFTVNYYANDVLSYKEAAISDDSALFITQSDRVVLFGLYDDPKGQEGYDITDQLGLSSQERIIDVYAAKEGFFLVTSLNRILGFGLNNNNDQFSRNLSGNDFTNLTILDLTEFVGLNNEETVLKIETGGWGSVALLTSEGRIIMWGYPHHESVVNDSSRYELSNFIDLEPQETFKDIQYGQNSTMVLTSDYRVFVWGYNWNGQLGTGNRTDRSTPTDISQRLEILFSLDEIKFIEAGENANFIVTNDNLIYMAGNILQGSTSFQLLQKQIDLNENEVIEDIQTVAQSVIVRTSESRVFAYGYKDRSFLSVVETTDDWALTEFMDLFASETMLPGERIIDMDTHSDYALFVTNFGESFFMGTASWFEAIKDEIGPFALESIDYQGWVIYETDSYLIDETISLLDEEDIEDYTFNGWFTNPSLNTTYNGPLTNVNLTLYGDLGPLPSTLTFNSQGGSAVETISGLTSDPLELPTPSRTGYIFEGWYLDQSTTNPFFERRMPGGNTTLYAKWEMATYQIDYYRLEEVTPIDVVVTENNVLMISDDGRLIAFGAAIFQNDSSVNRDLTDLLKLRVGEELVSVHAGGYWGESAFMVVTNQGRVFGFGFSSNGLLSETTDNDWGLVERPRNLTQKLELQAGETIIKLELEYKNAMILTSLGRVIVWGDNGETGVLGVGHFDWGVDPTDITESFDLEANDRIIDISMGNEQHVIALSEAGRVFTWGAGTNGELGNNRTVNLNVPTELNPLRLGLNENETIVQIETGERLTFIRTSLNRVLMFGDRNNPATLKNRASNVLTPLDVTSDFNLASGETISHIAFDYRFLAIYTSLGNTYYSGAFNGINYSNQPISLPSSLSLASEEFIKTVDAYYNYGVILTNTGTLYVGGSPLDSVLNDSFGQLKSFTPNVYELVETQTLNYGETITYLSTTSAWLDVELLSDLDISQPITLLTMPDRDLTLYEQVSE